MGRVEGKVALVTGAARGQGRSHAVTLAREGADIIAIDTFEPIPGAGYPPSSEEDLAETVAQVEALDRRIVARKADVRSLQEVRDAVDAGVAELGRLDIVSANAGIMTGLVPFDELTDELWADTYEVNTAGVWRTCVAAVPHIRAGGRGGSIVVTSSAAGLVGVRNLAHYVASKWGVIGLVKSLAIELGDEMIRVNTVSPTQVDTDLVMNDLTFRRFRPELENPTKDDFAPASQRLHVLPVPWLEPIDVSQAVLWLASDESRYVTGIALPVDAGTLIHR